jgi:5-methylcytosine-specific restriction endonuclease McrA
MASRMTDVPWNRRNLWGQRGNVSLPPTKRGEGGAALCRWCWTPVPKGRRYWCSNGCVTDYRQRADWSFIRDQIIERDKVCRCCGGCTYTCKGGKWRAPDGYTVKQSHRHAFEFYGVPVEQIWGPFNVLEQRWEVDHITPVISGGTDDPANLRLLCVPCHHMRTAVWLRDRAAGPQAPLALD